MKKEVVDEEGKMSEKKKDELLIDHNHDGIDRRGFLKCMAWAGTGALCVMQGGVLKSYSLSRLSDLGANKVGELSFVQISDSHMGFNKAANPDVIGTLKAAVDKINGLAMPPEFMLHTGDISHLSKPEEFDTVDQILKCASAKDVFFVPGEHDVLGDDGKQYLERYGKNAKGAGWYSFDKKGVHFIGSVTVLNGHIHQTMQKVEGNVTFHTAASTAFPQPAPGKADSPGPMKVPAEQLKSVLGITDVNYVRGQHALAVVDSTLG